MSGPAPLTVARGSSAGCVASERVRCTRKRTWSARPTIRRCTPVLTRSLCACARIRRRWHLRSHPRDITPADTLWHQRGCIGSARDARARAEAAGSGGDDRRGAGQRSGPSGPIGDIRAGLFEEPTSHHSDSLVARRSRPRAAAASGVIQRRHRRTPASRPVLSPRCRPRSPPALGYGHGAFARRGRTPRRPRRRGSLEVSGRAESRGRSNTFRPVDQRRADLATAAKTTLASSNTPRQATTIARRRRARDVP